MNDIKQLKQIMQALSMVLAMPDFVGQDHVEMHLRWAAKNYAERIFNKSNLEN